MIILLEKTSVAKAAVEKRRTLRVLRWEAVDIDVETRWIRIQDEDRAWVCGSLAHPTSIVAVPV